MLTDTGFEKRDFEFLRGMRIMSIQGTGVSVYQIVYEPDIL